MAILYRKLRRDLLGSTWILVAVVLIMAVGTGVFVGMRTAQRILIKSQSGYYTDYNFADFWIDVKKAPLPAVERVGRMPGMARVESRVVFDVIVDVPGTAEPITGRLISTPPDRLQESLNGVCLVSGSGFSSDRDEEVILSNEFANTHGLSPGDHIDVVLNRKKQSLLVVGTAISPEYVYMVRGSGDVAPDPQHFAVLYVRDDYAREVLGFKDACNQITGTVSPWVTDVETELTRVQRVLEPYGVVAVTPRERQASHRFLSDEINGLGKISTILSTIFLFVAALVLNVVMSRMAERQRTIVGTLKAIGYGNRAILVHFLSFGSAVGLLGGLAGIGVGIGQARMMIVMYKQFFQFPEFPFSLHAPPMVVGVLLCVAFGTFGALKGTWFLTKLSPAAAMRARPPAKGGAIFLERFPWLWRRLGFRTHIALRQVFRNPTRTVSGVVASSLATAIMLTTLMQYDSVWYLLDFQFDYVVSSDADIGMREESSLRARYEAQRLPGVDYAEESLHVVCDLRNGRYARRMAITGLRENRRLTIPREADLTEIDVPRAGLAMGAKLAEVLHVDVGDGVELTPVRGRRDTVLAPVVSITDGFLGLSCYADMTYLSGLVGESVAVNSVQLSVNPVHQNALYCAIKQLPNAQGFSTRANARDCIRKTVVDTMGYTLVVTIIFAGVIAFGSTINTSMIEIADRRRDIATFRVLGYQPRHVAGIFLIQNLIIFAFGLAFAIPLGYALLSLIATLMDTELFRMPVVVKPMTILITAAAASVFVAVAQFVVYWQITKLQWRDALLAME